MNVIAQRDLRNDISSVLKRARDGEVFTITVNGDPVAELGPLPERPRRTLNQILASTPVDPAWSREVTAMRAEDSGDK